MTERLTRAQRDMLAHLKDGPKLAGAWDFSGSRVSAQLIAKGLVESCDHPTVVDRRSGAPAKAYRLAS